MIKPIAEIHHKPGKRSIVYADDYLRMSTAYDDMEKKMKDLRRVLFEAGKQICDQPLLEKKIEDILD